MCLMIMEVIRFNTWDAFNRALLRVETYSGRDGKPCKMIHGQIYLPAHRTFRTWEEFHEAVKEIKELGERISNRVRIVAPASLKAGFPDSNDNDALPSIYGEIYVEITDPWIRRY